MKLLQYLIFIPFQQIVFVHHPSIDQLPLNNNIIGIFFSSNFLTFIFPHLFKYIFHTKIIRIYNNKIKQFLHISKLSVLLFHQGSNVTILRTLRVCHPDITKDRERRGKELDLSISISLP